MYVPCMEPATDGGTEHAVGTRWWVAWLAGFLASGATLVALSTVFPVAMAVLAGFGATVGAAWRARGPASARETRGHWVGAGFSVVLFAALGLLLGATGLSIDDDHRGNAAAGAVLGGVLFVIAGGTLVGMVLAVRRRRRPLRADE